MKDEKGRKMQNRITKLLESKRTYSIVVYTILGVMSLCMMFFYSPLCPGGDFYVHFNRLVVLMEAIQDGSFPYYMDYYVIDGYGYLIKAFYADFILIPFALVAILTSATTAWQIMIFTLTFFCGSITYIAVNKIFTNRYAALLSALLYTFATYRIFDIYIRGALGEVISFSLLPLVLLGSYEIVIGNYKRWYILTVAFSLLIYSHVISTVITFLVLIVFLAIYYKSFLRAPKRFYTLLLSGVVAIPLTAYYVFPMLEQMLSNSFYYQTHPWSLGIAGLRFNEVITGLFNSVSLRNEQLFPKLGALLTFVVIIRVFVRSKSNILKFADICAIVGLVFLFMTTPLFPWKIYPFKLLEVIQFSWRLFEYTSFLFAIAGGYYLSLLLNTRSQKLIGLIGIITIHILIFNSDSIHYKTFVCKDGNPEIEVNTSFSGMIGGEYLPSKLPSNNFEYTIPEVYNDFIHHRGQTVLSQNSNTIISNFKKNKGTLSFDIEGVDYSDRLELPLTYYKGYEIFLDRHSIEYEQSRFGLIEVPVTKPGKMEVKYTGTILQSISFYITLITILFLAIFVVVDRIRKNK